MREATQRREKEKNKKQAFNQTQLQVKKARNHPKFSLAQFLIHTLLISPLLIQEISGRHSSHQLHVPGGDLAR
jgi:hypothetical protein